MQVKICIYEIYTILHALQSYNIILNFTVYTLLIRYAHTSTMLRGYTLYFGIFPTTDFELNLKMQYLLLI